MTQWIDRRPPRESGGPQKGRKRCVLLLGGIGPVETHPHPSIANLKAYYAERGEDGAAPEIVRLRKPTAAAVEDIYAANTFAIEAEALAPRSIAARWDKRADPGERAIIHEWVRMLRKARGRSER